MTGNTVVRPVDLRSVHTCVGGRLRPLQYAYALTFIQLVFNGTRLHDQTLVELDGLRHAQTQGY